MAQIARPEDLPTAFQAAWNAHDMTAFGEMFQPNATFVNRFATYVRGLDEIVELHRGIHESIYRDSTLAIELIAVDFLADTAAVVHFWTRLTAGVSHPAGPHQVDTLIMAVVTKRDSAWRIQSAENVTLSDPRTGAAVLRLGGYILSTEENQNR